MLGKYQSQDGDDKEPEMTFFFLIILFMLFIFDCAGFSLVVVSTGYCLAAMRGLLMVASLAELRL